MTSKMSRTARDPLATNEAPKWALNPQIKFGTKISYLPQQPVCASRVNPHHKTTTAGTFDNVYFTVQALCYLSRHDLPRHISQAHPPRTRSTAVFVRGMACHKKKRTSSVNGIFWERLKMRQVALSYALSQVHRHGDLGDEVDGARFVNLANLARKSHRPQTRAGCPTQECCWLLANLEHVVLDLFSHFTMGKIQWSLSAHV